MVASKSLQRSRPIDAGLGEIPWHELWDFTPLRSSKQAFREGMNAVVRSMEIGTSSEEQARTLMKALFAVYVESAVTDRFTAYMDTGFWTAFHRHTKEIRHGRAP